MILPTTIPLAVFDADGVTGFANPDRADGGLRVAFGLTSLSEAVGLRVAAWPPRACTPGLDDDFAAIHRAAALAIDTSVGMVRS